MKKLFLAFFISAALISCDESPIQKTSESIKSVDSLLTKANEGLKTLDSLSKKLNDSNGIARKVILPEIERQRKSIDSTLRSGGYQIDSINKEIEKITRNVGVGNEVVKTLDSANHSIQKGENAITVLARAADRILNQTKRQNPINPRENNSISPPSNPNNSVVIPPMRAKIPLVKKAKLEIEVEDLSDAKALLKQKIRDNNAAVVSENFSQSEGFQNQYFAIKVPLENFDNLVENSASNLGTVKLKRVDSEGIDYVAGQMSDLEITLVQNGNIGANSLVKDNLSEDSDSFSAKSSNAFMAGFKVLGEMFVVILPFWPLFLIGGLIFYLVRRIRKKKVAEEFERNESATPAEFIEPKISNAEIVKTDESGEKDPPDYSKYLPKE